MRLVPRFQRLVVGLSIIVCQLTLGVWDASAWGFGGRETAQAPPAAGDVQVTTSLGPVPRWADGQAAGIQGQPPSRQAITDSAVQQAAWSSPMPSTTNSAARYPASAPSQGPNRAASTDRNGPMFRGREIHFPSLFGRSGAASAAPTTAASSPAYANRLSAGPGVPNAARAQATAPRVGASPGAGYPAPAPRSANPPQQPAQTTAGRGVTATQPAPPRNAVFQSPSAVRPAQSPAPHEAEAVIPVPIESAPPSAKPSAGKSAGEQLAALAHQWSTTAESDADFTRIIETCRRARASQPDARVATYVNQLAGWALNRRGQLKAEAGQLKEALLDFDDAIRADGKCWRAIHNRGVLLAQDGQFEKAFDDFNRTVEINPDFAKAYSNRAALFVVANDLDAALEDYGRAIELDPNLAIAHRGRGRACHLLGRLDEAIAHYDAAVQLAPDDVYAIASRADLLTDLGRYADAAAEYNQAIEMDPESLQAYSGSAWLLATCPDSSVRDPELAVERARVAIELGGETDAVNFDTLAAAQASAGDFRAATTSVRQAIELASAQERDVYHDRLLMYQHSRPYRIAPVRAVTQASFETQQPAQGSARNRR